MNSISPEALAINTLPTIVNGSRSSALENGIAGFERASSQMSDAASSFAHGSARDVNFTQSAIDMKSASLQAQASAEVIRRSDEMLGSIIDVFA
ncbi:hypothetical protein PN836_012450 [Ningiella sp. W23]|uniref:hypothetical protein n=1 Tax=Ningiella sp. W23 TaxID=3023715 RepID=UPI003757F8AA